MAIARARKIFIPHVTKNITIAFELYQEVLAEQDRKRLLNYEKNKDYGIFAKLKRPRCPDCDLDMGLRLIDTPKGKANKNGWKSCWICEKCLYEEYSYNTLQEWLEILPPKENEDGC